MVYQLQGIATTNVYKVQIVEPSPRLRCICSHWQMGV
jgi:hypothetical protein